jgi:outer membrane protein OmpA-like peptidoglycan-associated protein/tetratricopeptide (TPR) repeat protein
MMTKSFHQNKMIRVLSLFLFLSLCTHAFAQKKFTTTKTANDKLKTIYDRGMRMASLDELDDALEDFEKALKMDPTFIDAQIQWANVKNAQLKFEEAKQGYEKALAIDSTYEMGVFYSLGIVEFDMGKHEESVAHFEHFLKNAQKISPSRRAAAEKYLRNVKFAAEAYKNPVAYEPKNLGPNINTPDAEYLPTLTADGQVLIYTAFKGGQEDFYRSEKVNGEWQPGKPIEAVNTPNNEGAQSISADGKFLIFTACHRRDGLGGCDLFFAELKNGKWTAVRNLGAPVNTPGWESQPSLSSDGKTLYFCSDRKGGKGGKDIWVSQRLPDGKWGSPESLGDPVNTPGDEQAPFIHADGQTLYFMSNGHPGMGGFDLYLARKHGPCSAPCPVWNMPQNLGYPINSEGNEGALSVSLDGKTAYFATDLLNKEKGTSSFDNPQGKGTTDIYSFELPEKDRPLSVTYVKATVKDASTQKPIIAQVEFIDLTSGKVYASATTEADGEFLVTLPAGGNYALNVSKEKYLFYSENFALTEPGTEDEPFLLAIALLPVPTAGAEGGVAKPIVLKNVFFETGSAALKPESLTELARLKKLLDENSTLKIQINGHTDNVGSDADNLKLSENRAKAVYDHLTQNGVEASRLKFKGFGEAAPAASNDTEEGRRVNRRTEYQIIY